MICRGSLQVFGLAILIALTEGFILSARDAHAWGSWTVASNGKAGNTVLGQTDPETLTPIPTHTATVTPTLTVTPTTTLTLTAAPSSSLFLPLIARGCEYFDDFSDPASGWTVDDNYYVKSEYLGGEFRVWSKQPGYYYPFQAPRFQRQNYVVEADARWEGAPGENIGLIFGVTSNLSRFYLFDVKTDSQQYRLLRRDPASYSIIVNYVQSPAIAPGNAKNHLGAKRDGNQITLTANGTTLLVIQEGTLIGATGVGIVSSPYDSNPVSDARFDNFMICNLP